VLEALDLDDNRVLLQVGAHLGVKDQLALLLGEVRGEDDFLLYRAEDGVEVAVVGLGEYGPDACWGTVSKESKRALRRRRGRTMSGRRAELPRVAGN